MPPHNGGKLASIAQILHIHVTDAGNKRRVMHEKQGGARWRSRQNTLQPSEAFRPERPVIATGSSRIYQYDIDMADRAQRMQRAARPRIAVGQSSAHQSAIVVIARYCGERDLKRRQQR